MKLEDHLGYFFFDKTLLKQALTTEACALEQQLQGQKVKDQQAYIALGEAILATVLTELLVRMGYQNLHDIQQQVSILKSEETLNQIAQYIGVGYVVKLSTTEKQENGYENLHILATTLTAIMGAIYFDGGFRAARETLRRLFHSAFPDQAE